MNIVNMAYEIIELLEDRDYWRSQALYYKEAYTECMLHINDSIKMHEESFASILTAALDPNSAINCMVRAIERDPLMGAIEEK